MPRVNDYEKFAAMRQQELKSGQKLPHRFVEKPAMKKLLRNLKGKKVLMLGCGTGEEALLLSKAGATNLVGIDVSPESIRLAKETYPQFAFLVGDMHKLDFPDNSFDFVYSSLVVHYSPEPLKVYKEVARVLKPGGNFQFSVGHPVRWASQEVKMDGHKIRMLAFSEDKKHPKMYGNYLQFEPHSTTFATGETLRFWVGAPSMHFSLLKEAGFAVEEFVETHAIPAAKKVAPYYYKRYNRFPQFIVFVAKKM